MVISTVIVVLISQYTISSNAAIADGKSKFLGNVMGSYVPANYGQYWNQVTPENATKWGSVEGTRDSMNWGTADSIYNYARSNSIPFKFHTLVWGNQAPSWISGLSQSEQLAEILEWFDAAAAKYGDSDMIDVVNEPLHAPPSYKEALGGDGSTGWDWVIKSFEEARSRFSGKLILNDYGIVNDASAANNYLTIINLLKSRGLIDGIGCQAHLFNLEDYSASTIKSNLDTLAATGIPIYISEVDLSGDDATQLTHYQEKFPVLWEHPGVAGVTLWGYIQGETWRDNTHLVSSGSVGASERPAMQWLKEYVSGTTSTSTPVNTPTPVTNTPTNSSTSTPTPSEPSTGDYSVDYTIANDWGSGATINVAVNNNTSSTKSGWSVSWTFSGNQQITSLWNASYTQSGASVTVTGTSWNADIPAGGSASFGFNISYSGSNSIPTDITVN